MKDVPVAFLSVVFALSLFISALPVRSQDISGELKAKIDAVVASAYQAATAQFPCKVKSRGKLKMLRWEEVDRCLNSAAERVDWENLSRQLETLRASAKNLSAGQFSAAVEASLSALALPYEGVFSVKGEDMLLPLTNSVLKFLPADSLQNLPVIDRVGTEVGTFSGVYSYERSGGLATANTYRLVLFQYTDRNGNLQSAAEKLLLDSFGVPWKQAKSQKGFRLTSNRLYPEK